MVMLVSEFKGEVDELLDSKEWIAELKRDGNRVQIKYFGGDIIFYNRHGDVYTKDIPQIITDTLREAIEKEEYITQAVIDGELTYTTLKGIDHRTQAQNPNAEPMLWIWDILELNREDLRERTWIERKVELKTVCDIHGWTYEDDSSVRYLPHYMDKRGLLELAEDNKMEGIVLKKTDSQYAEGKTKDQYKVKFAQTDDFVVIGYTNASEFSTNTKGEQINNKRFPYFKALILAQYDKDGNMVSKAQCGGGFNDKDLEVITPMLYKEEQMVCPADINFTDKTYGQSKGKIQWLKKDCWFPIEVKMHGLTEYSNPFQPRFVTLRDDKKIEECIEQ